MRDERHADDSRAWNLFDAGLSAYASGDVATARRRVHDARDAFVQSGQAEAVATCDANLGALEDEVGAREAARRHYAAAMDYFGRHAPADDAMAICELNLGVLECEAGEHDAARTRLMSARAHFDATGRDDLVAKCDLNLGVVELEAGDARTSRERSASARRYFAMVSSFEDVADCDLNLADAAVIAGDVPAAREHLAAARAIYRTLGLQQKAAHCDIRMASSVIEGEREPATAAVDESVALAVPAALLLDAGRFALDSVGSRSTWVQHVAGYAMRTVFDVVSRSKDAELMAALIAESRNTGSYAPSGDEHGDDARMPRGRDPRVAEPAVTGPGRSDDPVASGAQVASTASTASAAPVASTASCRILGVESLRMALPAQVKRTDGSIVLAEHLRAAVERYPGLAIRSAATLRTRT